MASRTLATANQMLMCGYAVVLMTRGEEKQLTATLAAGSLFFQQDSQAKIDCASADRNSGFRAVGEEYSQSATRPDLNESYSIWGSTRPSSRPADSELSRQLLRWQRTLAPYVQDLLDEVRRLTVREPGQQSMSIARSSYAQMNHYASTSAVDRDLLQDAHEDGHLVTLLVTTGPGLEIADSANGPFKPRQPPRGTFIAMPGSALTAVSGGTIKPLYHQVRNHHLAERFSLMYFVNPDVSQPVYGWHDTTQAEDLGPAIAAKPGDFGLPSVPR